MPMRPSSLLRLTPLALASMFLVSAPAIYAESPAPEAVSIPDTGLKPASLDEYRAHLTSLRTLIASCKASTAACDPSKVGAGDRIAASGKDPAFDVHWNWLWDLILKAKDPKLASRDKLLDEAASRLEDHSREAGIQTSATAIPFDQARSNADKVLARSEFKQVTRNSLWDVLLGRFFAWLSRIFGGVSTLGQRNPWLGPLIEWGFVALALTGLLVWVRRVMARQRLAIRMESPSALAKWQETSRNWAALAETAAAHGDWREAVHSLYWATVTELEGRRIWRQNSARTPREYLRLLTYEAPQYRPLRTLTQLLERIWYGLAPADREDYDKALAVYEELRQA